MSEKRNTNRELQLHCPECGYTVIEEQRYFGREKLSVAVCPSCHWYDWVVPSAYRNKEEDDKFEESQAWAKRESQIILEERGLMLNAGFSEPAKHILGDNISELTPPLLIICKLLDRWNVYVSQYETGIRINITR